MLQVVRDLKRLTIVFQPPGTCTATEREALTVASAKASLSWHAKWQHAELAHKQARSAQFLPLTHFACNARPCSAGSQLITPSSRLAVCHSSASATVASVGREVLLRATKRPVSKL